MVMTGGTPSDGTLVLTQGCPAAQNRLVRHEDEARASVVSALRSTLFVTLQTDVVQPVSGALAVQDYTATVNVAWSPDEGPDVDLAALSALADTDVQGYLPELDHLLPDTLVLPVGEGTFTTADLWAPTCWDELAGRGHDAALVGGALLGEAFNLAELQAAFEIGLGRAVIVNSMEVVPEWRGAKYGLLALELGVRELGKCADVAALFPMEPNLEDLEAREAAARGLSDYWGQAGFVDFNGIMVKPLTSGESAV